MALLAIVISLTGTVVSIVEANILSDQQELILEEKAASVWPFLEVAVNVDLTKDETCAGRELLKKPTKRLFF